MNVSVPAFDRHAAHKAKPLLLIVFNLVNGKGDAMMQIMNCESENNKVLYDEELSTMGKIDSTLCLSLFARSPRRCSGWRRIRQRRVRPASTFRRSTLGIHSARTHASWGAAIGSSAKLVL